MYVIWASKIIKINITPSIDVNNILCFQLKKQGFTNIDALDPSEEMLQQTRGKQLYCQLYCDFLQGASAAIPAGM